MNNKQLINLFFIGTLCILVWAVAIQLINYTKVSESTVDVGWGEEANHKYYSTRVTTYTSTRAKLRFEFKEPVFVREEIIDSASGYIFISRVNSLNREDKIDGLQITFGIPELDKGSSCPLDASSALKIKNETILGQTVTTCEGNGTYYVGFPVNKQGGVEYWMVINAKEVSEYSLYKECILNGITLK